MFSLKQRFSIFLLLWLIAAVAFAFAPSAPTDYPANQERIGAFLAAPLLFAVGLAQLVPDSTASGAVVFVAVLLYFWAQLACLFGQAQRRPILILSPFTSFSPRWR
jgi:hypothetical protein